MLLPRGALVLSSESDTLLKVFITILHVVAINSAIFRFFYRKSTQRLGWDDYVSLLSALVDCMFFALLWMGAASDNSSLSTISSRRIRYWLTIISSIIVVWADNTSILFAMARIFRFDRQMRRLCNYLGIFFIFLCLSIIAHVSVLCRNDSKWIFKPENRIRCIQSEGYRIYFTALYVMADTILITIPAYTLWCCSPSRNQARLFWTGLGAAIFGLMLDILYVVFLFAPPHWEPNAGVLRVRTGHLEASLSLLTSHVFFLTVIFYHHCRNEDIEATEESSTITLTDVEIDSADFDFESRSTKPASVRNNDH
ncbi:hypothetical protein BDQ17DRAFT_1544254 [Cyathus striatus]|nr:hypothetical protein BDQ17DRAFT_1544254 [Cyathus striatus]